MEQLLDRVLDFVRALRMAGVPVAISDVIDAQRAMTYIDLLDRAQFREALAATMISSPGQRWAFDMLFDMVFPPRPAHETGIDEPREVHDLIAELGDRIIAGEDAAVRRLAREAVERYGRVENHDGSTSRFAYQVFDHVSTAEVSERVLGSSGLDEVGAFAARLARDELEAGLHRFQQEVDAELRRRQAARHDPDEAVRRLVRPPLQDIDFFSVTAREQAAMHRAVRPLARRLSSRLAIRRLRGRDGRLDVRRMMRRALSSGGVPLDPRFRSKRLCRPELVLLCDVSGSVAAFAEFALAFCHAVQGQFSRVRSFVFIDTIDEVTRLFKEGSLAGAIARLSREADVVSLDGHSDYGHALEVFTTQYGDAIGPRTTLVILGDARNNYRAANTHLLGHLRTRSKRVYWLNPEPRHDWGTADSMAPEYARHCDAMVECRNLRQLTAFIERLGRGGATARSAGARRLG